MRLRLRNSLTSVSSAPVGGSITPDYPDAIASFDFANGVYSVGPDIVPLGDYITDTAGTISTDGMITTVGGSVPNGTPALLSLLNSEASNGLTIIIQFYYPTTIGNGAYLSMFNTANPGPPDYNGDKFISLNGASYGGFPIEYQSGLLSETNQSPSTYPAGAPVKSGYTLGLPVGAGNYRYCSTVNGEIVSSQILASDIPSDLPAQLGAIASFYPASNPFYDTLSGDGYIQRVTIYQAKLDADLATLTAP